MVFLTIISPLVAVTYCIDKVNEDGSVEWIASAAGGAGGGAALYLNGEDGTIDLSNYESIDVEFVYSPITGKWNPKANNPGFALRILPWDSTGVFGGYTDMEYFDTDNILGHFFALILLCKRCAETTTQSEVAH